MSSPDLIEEDDEAPAVVLEAHIDASGVRLDKVLAEAFPSLSRARLQALLAGGAVSRDGLPLTGGSAKAQPGLYAVALPPSVSYTHLTLPTTPYV